MRIDHITSDIVQITLSKRNLLGLLAKVDNPDSAKTIFKIDGDRDSPITLVVCAEQDAEHYDREDGPAGAMHPDAEAFIAEHKAT